MSDGFPEADAGAAIEAVYRAESRRVLATLVRLLGDFDLAEEATQDAFAAALAQWSTAGVPANPRAWLVSAGRFKGIDRIRRQRKLRTLVEGELAVRAAPYAEPETDEEIEDDRLRLIFTCCHPLLPPDAQVALTLREVCDLRTEEIAAAFLVPVPTIAQRIVRAKARIRSARIPYEVPAGPELRGRLAAVLKTIYLVFNEGYFASSGDGLTRADLCTEALRLGRLLVELLPTAESRGLLALMLLHDAGRAGRLSAEGEIVLLADQDRSRWKRDQIAEATGLVRQAVSAADFGPYAVQSAIAAIHTEAERSEDVDWYEVVGLYDVLLGLEGSAVVELNRAVAVAMRDGPREGLGLVDAILARGELREYRLAHAARGEFLHRLGRHAEAAAAWKRALELCGEATERRYYLRRLAESNPEGAAAR